MFNKLFEGKMRAYVKCCNVPYESSRDEAYVALWLAAL